MIGLDKITARIETDAAADAVATAQQTREQCARLLADADRQAQDRYWARAREGMKAVEDRARRLAGTADMEAKKSILAFKQETVASVFDTVEKNLLSLPEKEYLEFLAGKAVQAAATGREELILNPRDRAALGEKLVEKANKALAAAGKTAELRLAEETGDFKGGLLVRLDSVSVNATVEALVDQARGDMAAQVAQTLFS